MKFELDNEQMQKVVEWETTHECPIDYAGAIGGKTTFQFTPNSIGMTEKVVCACGAELNITDYDLW